MISVMFDTNVYRKVLIPSEFSSDKNIAQIATIHDAIIDKQIEGYLSEVIFQLEAVRKDERNLFFENYKPQISSEEKPTTGGDDGFTICISPPNKRIQLSSHLDKYIEAIDEYGFKVIRNNRIGMAKSNFPEKYFLKIENSSEFHQKNNSCGELIRLIEKRQVGSYLLKKLCNPNYHEEEIWIDNLQNIDKKTAAKAISEWCDGDAISACYGYGIDYFCTADEGKSAGSDSIFSNENKKWLLNNHNLKIVNLVELSKVVSSLYK